MIGNAPLPAKGGPKADVVPNRVVRAGSQVCRLARHRMLCPCRVMGGATAPAG
jgi:hypothetical protein